MRGDKLAQLPNFLFPAHGCGPPNHAKSGQACRAKGSESALAVQKALPLDPTAKRAILLDMIDRNIQVPLATRKRYRKLNHHVPALTEPRYDPHGNAAFQHAKELLGFHNAQFPATSIAAGTCKVSRHHSERMIYELLSQDTVGLQHRMQDLPSHGHIAALECLLQRFALVQEEGQHDVAASFAWAHTQSPSGRLHHIDQRLLAHHEADHVDIRYIYPFGQAARIG